MFGCEASQGGFGFIVSFPGPVHPFHSVRIEEMSGLGRIEDETAHALFELPVRNRKSFVLPPVFRPRLHNEILEIHPGILRIVKDAPAHCAVASPNPLVVVQRIQKFRISVDRLGIQWRQVPANYIYFAQECALICDLSRKLSLSVASALRNKALS